MNFPWDKAGGKFDKAFKKARLSAPERTRRLITIMEDTAEGLLNHSNATYFTEIMEQLLLFDSPLADLNMNFLRDYCLNVLIETPAHGKEEISFYTENNRVMIRYPGGRKAYEELTKDQILLIVISQISGNAIYLQLVERISPALTKKMRTAQANLEKISRRLGLIDRLNNAFSQLL